MSRTRKNDHSYRFFKLIIKFLVAIFIILIPLSIFFMTCRLENITVEGNNYYSKEEIIEKVINKSTDRNTLLLYGRYKYDEVDSIPFVEEVRIEVINKNTVKIHVYEKVIIGCIEHMGGYMYFDSDGYIVESSNEKVDKVPFITGLQFSKIVLYDKLEIPKNELFLVILNITQLIYKYELDVNTIRFNKENEITLDCGNIKVLLGKRDTYDEQIAELKSLIPNAENKKLVIDLRTFTEGQDKVIAKPYD